MPKLIDIDQDMLVGLVLGDLFLTEKQYPWLGISAIYSRLNLFSGDWLLDLEVEIDIGKPKTYHIRDTIDLGTVPETEAIRLVYKRFIKMAQRLSYQLFEMDPRIGLYRTLNFPYSPLFDPPYLKQPYRIYLSEPLHQRPTYRGNAENRPPADILQRCPLCNCFTSNFSSNFGEINADAGVWGGANLGFVHPRCVPWITPRLT